MWVYAVNFSNFKFFLCFINYILALLNKDMTWLTFFSSLSCLA